MIYKVNYSYVFLGELDQLIKNSIAKGYGSWVMDFAAKLTSFISLLECFPYRYEAVTRDDVRKMPFRDFVVLYYIDEKNKTVTALRLLSQKVEYQSEIEKTIQDVFEDGN